MHFNNIMGHDLQTKALKRSVIERRVSHAYLFSGPDGVGKKLVAIEFAKVLNCNKLKPEYNTITKRSSCDCRPCVKIQSYIHPDVNLIEFKGVKDIKVDQIREEIEEVLWLKSFEGNYKVIIVDEAERMNINAQNAFLKTLEEPPPESVIILIASQEHLLLPTIRSRCQTVNFFKLSDEIIRDQIISRNHLSEDQVCIATKISEGSLGKALGLDTSALNYRGDIITRLSEINPNLASMVFGFTESLPKGSTNEDLSKLKQAFEFISLWLRDLLYLKIGYGDEKLTNSDLCDLSRKVAGRWSKQNILDKQKILENAWYAIFRLNANRQLALENLVIKLTE